MSAEAIQAIANTLGRTTSPVSAEIKRAENDLAEFSKTPGYGAILLNILHNTGANEEIRVAASVALKNFIRLNWNADGEFAVAPLSPEERAELRIAILEAMFNLSGVYRRQLTQTVCIIGHIDFPNTWPDLIHLLAQQLGSSDFDRIETALSTIEQLIRRYRHEGKSAELFSEIRLLLSAAAAPITDLYNKMLTYTPGQNQGAVLQGTDLQHWLDIMLLETKCYYSLVWQDFPEFFEDHKKEWFDGFILLLRADVPDPHTDDSEPSTFDNIKRVICDIFRLFTQRYEEDFQDYMMQSIETVWGLLVATNEHIRYDSLVSAALGFLSAVCGRERNAGIFQTEGVLQTICQNVIIKNLTLRNEDLEQFEDEPFEYLKRDIEGMDMETRRRGAVDFVRALTKFFEREVFGILTSSVEAYLTAYAQNPQQEFVKKDVVYYLVSALASKSTTARYGATTTSQLIDITDFYSREVRNDLVGVDFNTHPRVLVADALNYIVLFRNQLNPAAIAEIFGGTQPIALRILQCNTRLLHHYVGYAFDKLYSTKRGDTPIFELINVPVQAYVEQFCQCLADRDRHKTHYLIKALLRCLSVMDPKTAESSNKYVSYLVQLVDDVVKESHNAQFTHMVFECLCVAIKKAFPYIQETLNTHIMPIIEFIISRDIIEFIPYVLQVVALLLEQAHGERVLGRQVVGAERYNEFFPHLLTGKFWQRRANAPALMAIFEAYVRTNPQLVLENINATMGLYQTLIADKALDEHGFRLAIALMPHYDVNDTVSTRNILLPMLNRIQSAKTFRFMHSVVMFLCRFAYVRGAMQLAEALNSIQDGMYGMVVEKVLIAELSTPLARNFEEKRQLILGLGSLIGDTVALLGPNFTKVVDIAVQVIETTSTARNANTDPEEQNDQEYSDPFCKLMALQHEEELGKDVDIKRFLSQAILFKAVAIDSSCLTCLSETSRQTLATYTA